MASAGGIRAGRAFVEIGSLDVNLKKGLDKGLSQLQAFGRGVSAVGKQVAGFGLALAAPLGLGVHAFANFDDALAALKSTVNPTAQELEKITAAISEISKATGVGPTKVTQAMVELLRAGVPLANVLATDTVAALKFAKVAGIDVAEAATVLADAMKVFGVNATTAVNVMSSAADASSSSLEQMVMAFAQASAVAKQFGLSIEETSAALGLFANANIKGSDAGTSLKTFLLRLLAPADEVRKEFGQLFHDLREGDGSMKPLVEVVGVLKQQLGGLRKDARDRALAKIFGADAIRAANVLLEEGTTGLNDFTGKMRSSLTVAQKFEILMDTISGTLDRAKGALERMGVTVGGVLGPAIKKAVDAFSDLVNALNAVLSANPGIIATVAKSALEFIALGAGLIAAGAAIAAVVPLISFLLTPLGAITGLLVAGTAAWLAWTDGGQKAINGLLPLLKSMEDTATKTFKGIADALKGGDLALAGQIFWAGLKVEWFKGVDYLSKVWSDFVLFVKDAYEDMGFSLQKTGMRIRHAAVEATRALIPEAPGAKAVRAQKNARELADVDLAQVNQQAMNRQQQFKDPNLANRQIQLADAENELDDLTKKASEEALAAAAPKGVNDTVTWTPGKKAGPAVAKEIDRGLGAAAKKVDVAGSFSASALSGLTAGESVSSKLEKQIEESKKQTKQLEKLNDKARAGRLVFT